MPKLEEGFLQAFRASSALGPAVGHAKKRITRRRAVAAAIIIAVLVVGTGYILITDSGSSARPNLLANGGFEAGDLRGWQTVPPYLPTVESSIVAKGSSYAARFQTPNDANVSSPCLTVGEGCGLLNTSTIYQNVYNLTGSGGTGFSFAVYPAFQYPSAFQLTLEFGLSPSAAARTGYSDVLVYYLVLASPQQCSSYSSDLLKVPSIGDVRRHILPVRPAGQLDPLQPRRGIRPAVWDQSLRAGRLDADPERLLRGRKRRRRDIRRFLVSWLKGVPRLSAMNTHSWQYPEVVHPKARVRVIATPC